jgi:hypothetical protein
MVSSRELGRAPESGTGSAITLIDAPLIGAQPKRASIVSRFISGIIIQEI